MEGGRGRRLRCASLPPAGCLNEEMVLLISVGIINVRVVTVRVVNIRIRVVAVCVVCVCVGRSGCL